MTVRYLLFLLFIFFFDKLFFFAGNNKLDGLELVKSLIHWHDEANHDPKSGRPAPEAKIFKVN